MEQLRRFNIYSDGLRCVQVPSADNLWFKKFLQGRDTIFEYFTLETSGLTIIQACDMQLRYNHMRMKMQPSVTVTYLLYKV
jgi:hypothetical protein